ncbi:MAG: hypothetical protein MI810_20105 [Flavobacteriales bacterium]|nr:hypothetical protein [Flavobacteriales bacterium]
MFRFFKRKKTPNDNYNREERSNSAVNPKEHQKNVEQLQEQEDNTNERNKLPSVKSILATIKSREDMKRIEELSRKHDHLFLRELHEQAFDEAYNKVLIYQFVPEDISLISPKQVAEFGFITFYSSNTNFDELKQKISSSEYDWRQITGGQLYEGDWEETIAEKPFYWESYLKFAKIKEQSISYEEKVHLINELADEDQSFGEEFNIPNNPKSLGDQWIIALMESHGIHLAEQLFEMGYTTPDKMVKADLTIIGAQLNLEQTTINHLKKGIQKLKEAINLAE